MNQFQVILLLLLLNALITLLYVVVKCCRKNWKRACIIGIFMLLCPITAPCYLFFSEAIYWILFRRKESKFSVEELSFRKDRVEIIRLADVQDGMNKVPIEDALLTSDKQNARKAMLNVLKDSYQPFLSVIAKAVEHDDSEVSHYAASAISDMISEFKNGEKEIRARYQSEKEGSKELAVSYENYLYTFLNQRILPEAEQRRYSEHYIELMEERYQRKEYHFVEKNYLKLMGFLLEENDCRTALLWVNRTFERELEELNVYKAVLKYYYTVGESDLFFEAIERLKKSEIALDGETLTQIRYFNRKSGEAVGSVMVDKAESGERESA